MSSTERGTPSNPALLDDALYRVAVLDFELPNRFVNHGPMACEALDALGFEAEIISWSRWFVSGVPSDAKPIPPQKTVPFDWEGALGDYRQLPRWLGHFETEIMNDGWESTVSTWVPHLLPGLAAAIFHGVIRTAHAVRGISREETPARRAELARALAHWSIWFQPGRQVSQPETVDDLDRAIVEAAADGARCYLTDPNVFNLHGVTGAMAVEILTTYLPPDSGLMALAQLRAEHDSLYRGTERTTDDRVEDSWSASTEFLAAESFDAHQVKLVEACKRGFDRTGESCFVSAAEVVTCHSPDTRVL